MFLMSFESSKVVPVFNRQSTPIYEDLMASAIKYENKVTCQSAIYHLRVVADPEFHRGGANPRGYELAI